MRGIAFDGDEIYVAASDELYQFDRNFRILGSWRNAYLKHCHEICKYGTHLYLTSTGFDSLLTFNLSTKKFDNGVFIYPHGTSVAARAFDPNSFGGPTRGIGFHFNNVFVDQRGIFISGRKLSALLLLNSKGISAVARLPTGTHNARPFHEGILFNDTEADALTFVTRDGTIAIPVPRYPERDLLNTDFDESGLARQGFSRGLCPISDTKIAAGSSPTTIGIYDLKMGKLVDSLNITMDVRNAAHGIAVWPYAEST